MESTMIERLGGAHAIVEGILGEFQGLNRVPRGSGNEAAEGKVIMERLQAMGLAPVQDEAGNVTAEVPATPGKEDAPLLILQGHMDMVITVRPGSGFDPLKSIPQLQVVDNVLCTDGNSTLGADNNLGNATVLWLLNQPIAHGPLRLLFTVSEEVGLKGASQVSGAWLMGAYGLLNTDGFHLGRAIAGSAGGRRETYARSLKRAAPKGTCAVRLALTGGTGGHSGDDIHKGRLNAVKALAAFLQELRGETELEVASFDGGTAHNAIPAQASAVLVVPADRAEWTKGLAQRLEDKLRPDFRETDPELAVTVEEVPLPDKVWGSSDLGAVCGLVAGMFAGVYAMHPDFPGVVGASANLARVCTEEDTVKVMAFIRCARREEADILWAQHDREAERFGFHLEWESKYPAWPGSPKSRLIHLLCDAYRAVSGEEMDVTAVHVGLEPSVLGEKAPGLVMVSTGPDILDAHSVDERAPLAGLPRYAATLAGVLESL